VVHAAGVLDDGILLRQDWSRFEAVLAPKVTGSWNLHQATCERPLDFFVLFSSTASLLGAPGQSNYAAASAFLDALAHHRRALGLPAVSSQFGAWSELGLAATEARGGEALARGMHGLAPREGLAAFEALLSGRLAEVGVVKLDVRQWLESHPQLAEAPLFSRLREPVQPRAGGSRLVAQLAAAPEGERRALLERHLREEAARLLRTTPEQIDPRSSLVALGLGSLVALEYRNHLEASLGATFPATLIWSHPTVAELTEHLAERLGLRLAPTAPARAEPTLHDEIDRLSDDEAEQALLAVLDSLEDPR
jgi:acyl carrier protein